MLLVKAKVKDSEISGKGLFALEKIPKSTIVAIYGADAELITEEEYLEKQKQGDKLVAQTGVRWAGKYFLIGAEITDEDFMNHSEIPSLLYHCGVCFALRDIEPGEELTVDYKYFLAKHEVCGFKDKESGNDIKRLSGRDAMLDSAKELIKLLEESDGWDQ